MTTTQLIRKTVGFLKEESPLQRAYQLKIMLEQLQPPKINHDHVRRFVGKIKP